MPGSHGGRCVITLCSAHEKAPVVGRGGVKGSISQLHAVLQAREALGRLKPIPGVAVSSQLGVVCWRFRHRDVRILQALSPHPPVQRQRPLNYCLRSPLGQASGDVPLIESLAMQARHLLAETYTLRRLKEIKRYNPSAQIL